jgi:hypothetical protein
MQPSDPLYPVHVFFLNLFNNEISPGETDVEHFTQVHMGTLQRIAEVFEQAAEN